MSWNGLLMVGPGLVNGPGLARRAARSGGSPTAGRGRSGGAQHEKELPATRFDLRAHR
jgi:hypothetical protein